jgi:hypothetical protein
LIFCYVFCAWYPAALEWATHKFVVKHGPLFWSLTEQILAHPPQLSSNWKSGHHLDKRVLWEHQREAVERLHSNNNLNIIWIPPGLGKTLIITTYIQQLIERGRMLTYCIYTLPPSAIETVKAEFDMLGLEHVHLDMRQSAKGNKQLVPNKVNFIYHDHLRLANLDEIRRLAPNMLFINDEFHKTIAAKTIRTSTALELATLAGRTIAMTGTLIKDTNVAELNEWLKLAVDFEVTEKNYWIAIASIISRKVSTKVVINRDVYEIKLNESEKVEYLKVVPPKLGGTATQINFRRAVDISYEAITSGILDMIEQYLKHKFPVFVVAKDRNHQKLIAEQITAKGYSVFKIEKDSYANFTPNTPRVPDVTITTPQHAEGYNMTAYKVMIQGVYFSNQATREQLERRINRIDQTAQSVRIITLHAGILSYIHNHYEKARNLSQALAGFAKTIDAELSLSDL